MYCPSCGTQNSDASRFCMKCGTSLPMMAVSTGTRVPAVAIPATSWSGWHMVGWIGLLGSVASVLAFFLITWLMAPVVNLGAMFGQHVGEMPGVALIVNTIQTIQSISASLNSDSGAFLQFGFSFLPAAYQSSIGYYFLNTALLSIVPIIGLVIAFNSYRLVRSLGRLRAKTRLRLIQALAIVGLLPVLALFVVVQLLIAVSTAYSNPYGGNLDTFSIGLQYMGPGYWIALVGLVLVLLAGPLAAPKQAR